MIVDDREYRLGGGGALVITTDFIIADQKDLKSNPHNVINRRSVVMMALVYHFQIDDKIFFFFI